MMNVVLSPDQYFHLPDGSSLKSLDDFKSFLKKGDGSVFYQHVTEDRNDFYNWIKDCIGDSSIAGSIKDKTSPSSMLDAINKIEEENSQVSEESESTGDFFSGSTSSLAMAKKLKATKPAGAENSQDTKVSSETDDKGASFKPSGADTASKEGKPPKRSKTKSKVSNSKSKDSKARSAKQKKDLKDGYKEDFDYSFDLDAEKEELDKIRERIARLNEDIGASSQSDDKKQRSTKSSKNSSERKSASSSVTRTSEKSSTIRPSKTRKRTSKERSKVRSKKGSNKNDLNVPLISEPDNPSGKDVKKEAQDKDKDNIEVVDGSNSKVRHEMENMYGQSISKKKEKKASKRNPLFKRLIGKFSRAEKVVADELPNLHEMEHGKKAQETFNPYVQIDHPWNYYNHGFPDFVKGLLIGMLIGMLFLALFL